MWSAKLDPGRVGIFISLGIIIFALKVDSDALGQEAYEDEPDPPKDNSRDDQDDLERSRGSMNNNFHDGDKEHVSTDEPSFKKFKGRPIISS